MTEKRQHAYLEAMNIPVWVLRHQPIDTIEAPTAADQRFEPLSADAAAHQQSSANGGVQSAPSLPDALLIQGRSAPEEAQQATTQRLKLSPGSDGILLVCARNSDSASKLASDIARALPKTPVWGWPDSDDSAMTPVDAVNENLFTCVAVFGDALAQLLFGHQIPAALGSATVVILPAMSELQNSAEARRKLWSELCRSGMIVL